MTILQGSGSKKPKKTFLACQNQAGKCKSSTRLENVGYDEQLASMASGKASSLRPPKSVAKPDQPSKGPGRPQKPRRPGGNQPRKPWRPNQGKNKQPWKNKKRRQKDKKKPARPQGIAHIHSTFNNTIVTLTSLNAQVLSSSSSGRCGFKGCRKSTPYAAQRAAEVAGKKAVDRNLKYIKVHVNGPGLGREKALRGLCRAGLKILLIRDLTRLPHNGCRPAKRRRV